MNLYQEFDDIVKCIFIGDPFVGKTSFCNKLVGYSFPYSYQSTIGVDFFIKIMDVDYKKYKLQIWDTTGQEKYNSITKSFYRNARFVIFLFDLNNDRTFLNLKKWMYDVENFCIPDVKKVLIGNKRDLKNIVKQEDIDNFCKDRNINYYSCSAKDDDIEELMRNIIEENIMFLNFKIIDNSIIKIENKPPKKCCIIL